jgi:predicted nucleic acid-binding Zn ribbon protein
MYVIQKPASSRKRKIEFQLVMMEILVLLINVILSQIDVLTQVSNVLITIFVLSIDV